MAERIIQAKCVDKAYDSKNGIQYYPGDMVDIDLSNRDQRKLVYLKTLGGRWVFVFDRANSSSTADRIFFCKECGQPFDRLSDIGNHASSAHKAKNPISNKLEAANADEEEERLLAERRAAEDEEEKAQQSIEA